jgi:hypothetical protein
MDLNLTRYWTSVRFKVFVYAGNCHIKPSCLNKTFLNLEPVWCLKYCRIAHTHWIFALTLRGPSLLWTGWRARCGYTHTHWMSALTLRGPSLLWTGWRARCLYWAVSGSVRPDGRDATRALCSQLASGLAGSRSLTFQWVELLDHTGCGARFVRLLYSAG